MSGRSTIPGDRVIGHLRQRLGRAPGLAPLSAFGQKRFCSICAGIPTFSPRFQSVREG